MAHDQSASSEDRTASLWAWHAECIRQADLAKASRNMRMWHYYSEAAAETLKELA